MAASTLFDGEGRSRTSLASEGRPISVTEQDVDEFATAVAAYKETSGRLFPTCSELLEVLRELGYAKRIWRTFEDWEIESADQGVISPA